MHSVSSFYIRVAITVILSCVLINSKANDNEREEQLYYLQLSFADIYLAKKDLELPSTEIGLRRCYRFKKMLKGSSCQDANLLYMDGVGIITTITNPDETSFTHLTANKALKMTLDIIERACVSKYEAIANDICYGGIMSLYFYTTPQQDAKILAHVKQYPKKIRNLIFNEHFYWFHNRPYRGVWTDYISKADIDFEYKNHKKKILNLFRKRIDELEEPPWVVW